MKSLSLGLGFVNLDVGFVSDFSCDMAISFLEKMSVHASFPVALLVTVVAARLPAHFMKPKNRQYQKALMIKLVSSLALILYPGLCTRLFASLKVVRVRGLLYDVLAVDYSVKAFGEEHMPFVFLAIGCMVVYVVGVPLAVLIALKSNKKYLYSAGKTEEHKRRHENVVDEFGTLYLQ